MNNIITNIELCKKNKERSNIFIDNEFAFAVSNEIIYKFHLKIKCNIDMELMTEIIKEDNYIKGKETALKYIERSYKTESEVRKKLLDKEYEEETIERIIEFLSNYNFINDNEYVERYLREKLKTYGYKYVYNKLIQKGIDRNIIERVYENSNKEEEETGAYELARNKYKSLIKNEETYLKAYRKLYDFLMRKGYSSNLVKSIVESVCNKEDFLTDENDNKMKDMAKKKYLKVKDKNKTMTYLISKGYDFDKVKEVVNDLANER